MENRCRYACSATYRMLSSIKQKDQINTVRKPFRNKTVHQIAQSCALNVLLILALLLAKSCSWHITGKCLRFFVGGCGVLGDAGRKLPAPSTTTCLVRNGSHRSWLVLFFRLRCRYQLCSSSRSDNCGCHWTIGRYGQCRISSGFRSDFRRQTEF